MEYQARHNEEVPWLKKKPMIEKRDFEQQKKKLDSTSIEDLRSTVQDLRSRVDSLQANLADGGDSLKLQGSGRIRELLTHPVYNFRPRRLSCVNA